MAYLAGNVAQFTVTFTNEATGDVVDPTTIEFSYSINGGSYTSPWTYTNATTPAVGVIARISTGIYEVWVDTTGLSGILTGLWVSTGTNQASVEDSITIGQTTGSGLTFGDLIAVVMSRAVGPVQERFAQINQTGGISSTTPSVPYDGPQADGVEPGCRLSVDLEEMLVTSTSDGTAQVIRGYNNSQQATHADDALLFINPVVTANAAAQAINDDLNDLSAQGLFRVGVAVVTWNPVFAGYDLGALPANYINILDVTRRTISPTRYFPRITDWDRRDYTQQVTDSAFPSGQALIIYEDADPGQPLYVTYSAPFIPLVNWTDSVLNTPAINDPAPPYNGYSTPTVPNLAVTMTDIPPLGAAAAIIQPLEISRNDMTAQPDPQKAADVPAQAIASSTNAMLLRRAARISAEADRLYLKYPTRR
jgi:hypothetical protein